MFNFHTRTFCPVCFCCSIQIFKKLFKMSVISLSNTVAIMEMHVTKNGPMKVMKEREREMTRSVIKRNEHSGSTFWPPLTA